MSAETTTLLGAWQSLYALLPSALQAQTEELNRATLAVLESSSEETS